MSSERGHCAPGSDGGPSIVDARAIVQGTIHHPSTPRFVFNQQIPPIGALSGRSAPWDRLAPLEVANSPWGVPGLATVSLHALAFVMLSGGAGDILVPPSYTSQDTPPQVTGPIAIPPAGGAAPATPPTVGRYAVPKFRVEFADGTNDGIVVYADAGSILSAPATSVKVEVLTCSQNFAIVGRTIDVGDAFPAAGIYTDVEPSCSVQWGTLEGQASAPGGMATFSQTDSAHNLVPAGPNVDLLFERPPFAKRLFLSYDATLGITAEWMIGGVTAIGPVTPSSFVGIPGPVDIPGAATHVRTTFGPGVPTGTPVHATWEVGVA